MERKQQAASEVLQNVVVKNGSDTISLHEINSALHERGFGILLVIFALPLSIPLPVPPGLTTVVALPLLLFSLQMIIGIDSPWLPKWVGNRTIKRRTLANIIEKTAPTLKKVEKLLRQRLYFASSRTGEKVIGVICFIFASSIAIPLPLTNFIPAIGISLISLGLLSKDGIIIIFGIIVGTFGVMLTAAILYFGAGIVPKIWNYIFG